MPGGSAYQPASQVFLRGFPQWGHVSARSDTSREHSGQLASAMAVHSTEAIRRVAPRDGNLSAETVILEAMWKSIGGALQLAGVALIFVGVYRTRSQLPEFVGLKARAKRLWNRIRKKPGLHIKTTPAALVLTTGGSVDVRALNWDDLDDSERIEALKEDLRRLNDRIAKGNHRTHERIRALEDRLKEARQSTSQQLTSLEAKVHAFAGGNLHLEATGAVCFFVGIILTTWAG